ncbi:MAG TPA: hypothetical protein P5572_18265 [Phycisphaerae bacterium]|nr:hypothetical protein [Phycisphaerae bacterium]
MRYLLLPMAVLTLAAAGYPLAKPNPDYLDALGYVALAATLGLPAVYQFLRARLATEFLAWAWTHREELFEGVVDEKGRLICLATPTVRYDTFISIVVGMRESDVLVLPESESPRRSQLACCVITVLLGWWSLPFGPIQTIRVIIHNLRGGRCSTVGEELAAFAASIGEVDDSAERIHA